MMLDLRGSLLILLVAIASSPARELAASDSAPRLDDSPRLRQPVAMTVVDGGSKLLVANGRSGSISVVGLAERKTVGEFQVGAQLADSAAVPSSDRIFVIDPARSELISLALTSQGIDLLSRTPVAQSPVRLLIAPDGKQCYVASLWARTISIIDVASGSAEPGALPRLKKEIALPFSPREMILLPGGKRLLVADAFGGQIALIDLDAVAIQSTRAIPAHNIRGLAISHDAKSLFISHQVLNRLARSEADDIHWGLLAKGIVRVLSIASVFDPKADILNRSWIMLPGEVGRGTGDPGPMVAVTGDRVRLLAGGTGEVLDMYLGDRRDVRRVRIEGRPTAALASADGNALYVASAYADAIAVIDLARMEIEATIPLGPPAELSPALRGERLFYDARLSHDSWFSCHSCHTDGHTNGFLADTLSDGTYSNPKRVPPLGGVAETGPWAWNGQVDRLEDQIDKSVRTTMRGRPISKEQIADIAAYLETIPLPPAPKSAANADAVARGRALFEKEKCNSCHAPPLYTSPQVYDVGLVDEVGLRKFNPPSLRGVRYRDAFFHDGRAGSLNEVISKHRHQLERALTDQERADLMAFLESL